jgi:hypothetical protein
MGWLEIGTRAFPLLCGTFVGIRHERIEPGHPEQNGRHVRMHRTLNSAAANAPKLDSSPPTRSGQQGLFETELVHERDADADVDARRVGQEDAQILLTPTGGGRTLRGSRAWWHGQ